MTANQALERFTRQWAILLTSYRRDGTAVGTPVSIAVEGDHAYVRTYERAWKVRRLRRNPEVEIAPSTPRGHPTGPPLRARARLLRGEESAHAGHLIARKYPILQGLLVPLTHRLQRQATLHYELRPLVGAGG